MDTERYSRNIGLFGAEGQRRIEAAKVGIAGLGGLGAMVAQQLAYLGVRSFALVDHDIVTHSSLNRLVGAVPGDAEARISKVHVAERMIRTVQRDAQIKAVAHSIGEAAASHALADVSHLFGCVDNDYARLLLTEHCATRQIPYFDLATDTSQASHQLWYGGRVFVATHGNGCLSCAGLLDQREIAHHTMEGGQRAAEAALYGIPEEHLDGTGPMVISLNGVVASLAVTEFVVSVTTIRAPQRHLVYRGEQAIVTHNEDQARSSCFYCHTLWARQPDDTAAS